MAKNAEIKNEDLVSYYAKIYQTLDKENNKDEFGKYLVGRVKSGKKEVYNKTQTEIKNFKMDFLDKIESVYPSIIKIMKNPHRSIRYDDDIVSVEKAKKINSDTVRHLASHTQYIREIDEYDNVIPSKVMTTFADEELAIYENRFIKSLVKRIEIFLERRYEALHGTLESFETQRLNVTDNFLLSGQDVTVSLDIAIKNDLTVDVKTTKEQYNRLLNVREMIKGLNGSEFIRALAKAKEVLPPIMKTNIILHNPDFKMCYDLWLYLDRYDGISNDIDIKEKSYKYSTEFDNDINQIMALALASFIKNREIEDVYASKNLPSIKAPKPEQNNNIELDLTLNAEHKPLEDYRMNELLLSQTAKFYDASLEALQESGEVYKESVRIVYKQMLDMLDQLYPTLFKISDDELESKDLNDQIDFQRNKKKILEIVYRAKQMNIARMGKEIKRSEKIIERLDNKIKTKEAKEREKAKKLALKQAKKTEAK
ncbi:MAG: DUF2357 domain-containing protein [Acholeplasmatales bacterium]|nr:DUF2357 domain-containing protein [Acholeplasmatales bacterium]